MSTVIVSENGLGSVSVDETVETVVVDNEPSVPGPQGRAGPPGPPGVVVFSKAGTVAVAVGKARFPIPVDMTIGTVVAVVDTAPSGANLIVQLLKNGTVIATVTIADGTNQATVTPNVPVSGGDYLTVDVVQVAPAGGWDLTVEVLFA